MKMLLLQMFVLSKSIMQASSDWPHTIKKIITIIQASHVSQLQIKADQSLLDMFVL